jgi:maltooligosyltrehalose synthase
VIAFARSRGNEHAITVAGRLLVPLAAASPDAWWADTSVELPEDLAGTTWKSILSDQSAAASSSLRVGSLFSALPTAVLAN